MFWNAVQRLALPENPFWTKVPKYRKLRRHSGAGAGFLYALAAKTRPPAVQNVAGGPISVKSEEPAEKYPAA